MFPNRYRRRFVTSTAMADCFIRAARTASSQHDLALLMEAVAAEMGFRHFALIHHADLRGAPTGRVNIKSYPPAVSARIIEQAGYLRDPILRASAFSDGAFLWSDLSNIIKLDRRDRLCLAQGIAEGLNEGITVPCFRLGTCMGSCTLAGTTRPDRVARYLGIVQMVGIFAFQAARRIVTGPFEPAPLPRLKPRPRECVLLAGRGLSNKEIARALSLTPRTVDGYMTEARRLFAVHDRAELVVSALFAGEIGPEEIKPRQTE